MTATTLLQRTVLPQLQRCRSHLHTSAIGRAPSQKTITTPDTRDYFYDIDQHGQLFLSGTKIRNFTSCYKDPAFLDFFYRRLKPLHSKDLEQSDLETALRLKHEGYTFISLCGKERNYIRSQDTPIVFRELIQRENDWILKYAGTLTTPFQPNALRVDKRGYLYHPSPDPASSQRRQRQRRCTSTQKINPYGAYSLFRSELVISQFGKSLEMRDDGSGSYEWLGDRRDIGLLADGEAVLGEGWVD